MNYDLDTKDGMANAVQWQRSLIETINDAGMWAVPRSATLIRIHKKKQIAQFVTCGEVEHGIARVFKAMGWKVTQA